MTGPKTRAAGRTRRLRRWLGASAHNAVELARLGRLGAARPTPFEVVERRRIYRLRRYVPAAQVRGPAALGPLLLVPPLMVTAEIYDVSPEQSAVSRLVEAGVETWVMDFGSPEREEGGMARTLDDHVRAVAEAVELVRAHAGRDVHLGGYSQGGMFAYQAAAYRRSDAVASVVTFGAPVDIHKNVPAMASDIVGRFARALRPLVARPLGRIEGVPGFMTSAGFKLLAPHRELQQLVDFVRKLHDRRALERRESRRRFLGGEGFVAWPGPALRRFIDEFVVHNRMLSGGMVIEGRTVTLADIRCPILYFVGLRDDFARPAAVRAIRHAAPHAEPFEIALAAGHFGLVVGNLSLRETWPAVVAWLRWRAGMGPLPAGVRPAGERPRAGEEIEDGWDAALDYRAVGDELGAALRARWEKLGDGFRGWGNSVHALRWQLPRLGWLQAMHGRTKVSAGAMLARRARRMPDETFFLWKGRAFSYADADRRVGYVAMGLIACGVEPGDRVGVLMDVRPSYLSVVTALGRLGAVAVLLSPELRGEALDEALGIEPLRALVADPENAERALGAAAPMARRGAGGRLPVLVLGGGPGRTPCPGVVDMEAIDPHAVPRPAWYRPDAGLARQLAMVLVSAGREGAPRVARVSHGRWGFSAVGVASACTLTPEDTVYCCLPLHHPAGIMVSVGGAIASGARLALSARFDPGRFWPEVRRYGATVVFYAGEMARSLLRAPPSPADRDHPVRLFAGSGMRADVWRQLGERFGVGVLEFYASTERNLVLANASGHKIGALGRPLPGSAELAVVQYDFAAQRFVERAGQLCRSPVDTPGVAIARLDPRSGDPRARRDAFERGDCWFATGDVLRQDADGDYWLVDRLADMVRTAGGVVATPIVEDVLYRLDGIELCAAYGLRLPDLDHAVVVASVVARGKIDVARLSALVRAELPPAARPRLIRRLDAIPMTEGFRPLKARLRAAGSGAARELLCYDENKQQYRSES
ncbi:MAG: AMP-binding protein [Deltaproteobacteria bacterium]|nr:AMP-binding protein [Deltaproteobacteria bacterium]